MSEESMRMASKMDKFEEEIDYKILASSISESEIILLDWPSVLSKIKLHEGGIWANEGKLQLGVVDARVVSIDVNLVNADKIVSVELLVYSEKNMDALNKLLDKIELSSSRLVNFRRIKDGPGDLFLVRKDPNDKSKCIMVYNNALIDITTQSTTDVTQFAYYLFNVMQNALQNKAQVVPPDINIGVSKHNINVGDEFTTTVDVLTSNSQDWKVDITDWPEEGLDILASSSNSYTFRATELGSYQIDFNIYHEKTLISYSKKIHINVIR